MFAIIKNWPIKLQRIVFAVKDKTPYGGIWDSEQLRRYAKWGYPEYKAINCVCHMVSPGLDGLRFYEFYVSLENSHAVGMNITSCKLG